MKIWEKIKIDLNESSDLVIKEQGKVRILFLESLCDSNKINEFILKTLAINKKKNLKDILAGPNTKEVATYKEILSYLFNGFAIIIGNKIYAIEVKGNLVRSVEKPTAETDIYGPKDSFNESIQSNLGLIKRRIKDEHLINDDFFIGRITKNKLSVVYLNNVAEIELVKKIEEKISKIDVDGVGAVGNIKQFLSSEVRSPLPTIIETERPDFVCNSLMEGKIIIIMDNTPFSLIMPAFFVDFINPPTDQYFKNININFLKIVRFLCLIITLTAPALYIALINYNQESIPLQLLTSFASQRQGVPFPSAIEALLMLITSIILRESDIRFPSSYGSSVSIVGALILGNAAVAAGLISPIMIIVVALSFITSMVFTDLEMINCVRTFRFLLLIFTIFLGLYGMYFGILLFLIHISNLKSLDKPYTYPLAPFDKTYFNKTLIRTRRINDTKRSRMLTKNITKGN